MSDVNPDFICAKLGNIDRLRLKQNATHRYSLNSSEAKMMQRLDYDNSTTAGTDSSKPSLRKISKEDLGKSVVLGQVDKKYIIIKVHHSKDEIVFIDQHAADERIKLEELLKPISTQPCTLVSSICLSFKSQHEYQLITSENVVENLKRWSIFITTVTPVYSSARRQFNTKDVFTKKTESNSIYVTRLPRVIVDKCISNNSVIKNIILDYAYWLKEQKDEATIARTCPRGISDILKSKACRSKRQ